MSKDVINVQIKDDADRRKDIDSLFNRLESSDVADWMVEHVRHSSLSFRLLYFILGDSSCTGAIDVNEI